MLHTFLLAPESSVHPMAKIHTSISYSSSWERLLILYDSMSSKTWEALKTSHWRTSNREWGWFWGSWLMGHETASIPQGERSAALHMASSCFFIFPWTSLSSSWKKSLYNSNFLRAYLHLNMLNSPWIQPCEVGRSPKVHWLLTLW